MTHGLKTFGVARVSKPCSGCGKPRDAKVYYGRKHRSYCNACVAAYMREWRKVNKPTPEQKRKDIARSYAGVYLRLGKIKREACVRCGSAEAEMHHHDYSKPLEIEWVCRRCHVFEHAPASTKLARGFA